MLAVALYAPPQVIVIMHLPQHIGRGIGYGVEHGC